MEIPLEIAFHNLSPDPGLEDDIRAHVAKLEKRYGRLTGCRVTVEAQHHQPRTGNVPEVHVLLRLPGHELTVTHEPHRAKQRSAAPRLRTILRDAFKAAAIQLTEFKEQRSGEVKPKDDMFQGRISELRPDEGFGFILTKEGTQLYFHRNSVIGSAFDRLNRGDLVHYIEAMGDTGPTASKVWCVTAGVAAEGQR
jgi:cold shock CspA family protein